MMKRSNMIGLLAMVVAMAGLACKKVIQVDLRESVSRVVIEAEITNAPGPYDFKISRTIPYSNDNYFPPVEGADVQVTDSNNGIVYTATEIRPGTYRMNFSGVIRHSYRLKVMVDSQEYTASSTMPSFVPLDSVSFAVNTDFNGKKEINAVANFQDPPGLGNNYQFIEYVNGRQIPNIFVFEDRLSDGRYVEDALYNDSSYMKKNDTLMLKMYCVDRPTYDYFFTLAQIVGNNQGFQSASPANPNTNLKGGALGYFSAHTIKQVKLIVY
jgi:hypothetical protein